MKFLLGLEIALYLTIDLVLALPTPSKEGCRPPAISFLGPRSESIIAIKTFCEESKSHTDLLRKRSNKNLAALPKTPSLRQSRFQAHAQALPHLPANAAAKKKLAEHPRTSKPREYTKASAVVVDIDPHEKTQLMDWEFVEIQKRDSSLRDGASSRQRKLFGWPSVTALGVVAGVLIISILVLIVDLLISSRAKGWPIVRKHFRRRSTDCKSMVSDVKIPTEEFFRIDASGKCFSECVPSGKLSGR